MLKQSYSLKNMVILILLCHVPAFAQQDESPMPAATLIDNIIQKHGIEAAFLKFKEMRAQTDVYSFSPSDLLGLGYKFLQDGKSLEAVAVLTMTTEAFPDDDRAYMALGRAYRTLGLKAQDRQNTNHAYDLRNARILADYISKNKNTIARTAEEVIDRYLKAIGGRENLMKIKTMTVALTALDAINQETAFIRYYQYPHHYRQSIVKAGASNVTDGKKVWRVTETGWQENPNSNFVYAPDIYGDFIDYEEKGISYELLGIESQDMQVLYRLLKTYQDGSQREYYFSAESRLFVMERRDFGVGKDIKRYYDWREVHNVRFPFLFVVTNRLGLGNSHGAITKEIKINEPLDESLFKAPQK